MVCDRQGGAIVLRREGAWRRFPQDPVYVLLGRVLSYPEFEAIEVQINRDVWAQPRIAEHCGAFPIL
jgi:hypothetical protein